ncbi:MAG: cysteine--tRNA ligase [Candidatus Taylorbacteria bacterium]|nr:cysteine--tRNA ligase [Candidatus Taylorbacteria bacterium]
MLKLYNTLRRNIEDFKSIKDGEVKVYNCGPTAYNYAHIGNLRAYIFTDILRRVLEWNGYNVDQVMNVTDVGHLTSDDDEGEDKMVKALRREDKPFTLRAMYEVATFYSEAFVSDLRALNIKLPRVMPRASDHIKEDVELISRLEKKGIAYKTSDGIYFDTGKFEGYGKLGGVNRAELREGARVLANAEKINAADFNLWKFSSDPNLGFDSPWGKGFPGWHIECSAMSRKYLGQPFDIHTGGVDHIGTHHNNEIAQSEAAYGSPLANYWLHNEHLNVLGGKMAKSGENFLTLRTLIEEGFSPLTYRYYLLGANYRTPMEFSWDALKASESAYAKLVSILSELRSGGKSDPEYITQFGEAVNNNLDTARGLAILWEMVRDRKIANSNKLATALKFDEVLGLDLNNRIALAREPLALPDDVSKMLSERENARKDGDWRRSDAIRENLRQLGYDVSDTDAGPKLTKI